MSLTSNVQLAELLRTQDGVIARRQLLSRGWTRHDVDRHLRRRDLARAWSGVYVTHTGPLTPRQRQWVAVLAAWPAALAGASALPELRSGRVQLVVGAGRQLRLPPGTALRRSDHLDDEVWWHRSPPRSRPEHAVIDVMSSRIADHDVAGAFHVLTQVAGAGSVEASRVLAALETRPRVRGRALIRDLLRDLRDGACSVLEREYLHRVERAHGLPHAGRQRVSTATGRPTLQDVPYPEFSLVVELDGRGFHSGIRSDADAFRDLAELTWSRTQTVRVTFGLVFTTPCRTARHLAELLRQRGWTGTPTPCHRCRRAAAA